MLQPHDSNLLNALPRESIRDKVTCVRESKGEQILCVAEGSEAKAVSI